MSDDHIVEISQAAWSRVVAENMALRYLCLLLLPELKASALLPGETKATRLLYMLGQVDPRAASDAWDEAQSRPRRPM